MITLKCIPKAKGLIVFYEAFFDPQANSINHPSVPPQLIKPRQAENAARQPQLSMQASQADKDIRIPKLIKLRQADTSIRLPELIKSRQARLDKALWEPNKSKQRQITPAW